MSKRNDNESNIIQFPPEASIDYYERQIDQGNLIIPRSFVEEIVWIAQWLDNPQNRIAGFRALTKAMEWPPNVANKVLDSLEAIGYAGFPHRVPIPEELLEGWQAIVKHVLRMSLRQRAILELSLDRAHASETVTHDMIAAKYKEIKKRRRVR